MSSSDATIVVGVNDALADVLDRLRFVTGRAARLDIPAASALFLTANEFRALKDAADQRGIRVTIESPDRLRLQLAGMFGFSTVNPAWEPSQTGSRPPLATVTPLFPPERRPPGPATKPPEPASAKNGRAANAANGIQAEAPAPRRADASAKPKPATAAPAGRAPDQANGSRAPHPAWPSRDATGAAPPRPAPKPAPRTEGVDVPQAVLFYAATHDFPARRSLRDRLLRRSVAKQDTTAPTDAPPRRRPAPAPTLPVAREDDEPEAAGVADVRARRLPRRRTIAIVAAGIAVVVLLALAAAYFLLPSATITLALKSQPVNGEVVYDVVAPGTAAASGADLTVPAAPFTFTVSFDAAAPTTGVRLVPDGTASGSVRLSNPNRQAVTIEQGTTVASDNGVKYVFAEKVTVPAGNPPAGQYGRADASVRAAHAGGTGNLDTGALDGRLDSGVYYSNREGPISGGSDKKVATVTQTDLDHVKAQADDRLRQLVTQQAAAKVPAGQALLTASVKPGTPTYAFDHKQGDDAAKLSLHVTVPVAALAFNPQDAVQAATRQLHDRLAGQAPAGYVLDDASLRAQQPIAVSEQADRARFRVVADAQVHAVFSDAERQQLADKLAGKDAAAAEAMLKRVPGVEGVRVSYWPGWLPERMPRWANRITFKTDG